MLPESPVFRRTFGLWNLFVRGLTRLFAPRFLVTGRSNLPRREGVIFAPNHTSDSDPFWVGAAIRSRVWWMAKQEIFRDFPIAGAVMRFVETFPVDQKGIDREALERCGEILERGESIVIFPEGHCSRDGNLQPLEHGLAMLALKHKARVVPIGAFGATHVMPFAQLMPRPTLKKVHLHFGRPIDLSDLYDKPKRGARTEATRRVAEGIQAALDIARR